MEPCDRLAAADRDRPNCESSMVRRRADSGPPRWSSVRGSRVDGPGCSETAPCASCSHNFRKAGPTDCGDHSDNLH